MCAPACYGGDEADPATTIGVIEAISEADGATGWALMIGLETVGLGLAWLPPEAAEDLLADTPRPVFCGALNPRGVAQEVPGGYRVSGQWPFASGCMHADYFWGMCVNHDDPNDLLEVIVPRASYEILPTWQVNGLRGSGSHDVAVEDLFIPESRVTRTRGRRPVHQGTLFGLPPFSRLAYNKVGVSLGIARAAIDAFVELCSEKTPRLSTSLLRDRPRAQLAVAEAEAAVRSAKAFVLDACRGAVGDGRRRRSQRPPRAGARAPGLFPRLPGGGPGRVVLCVAAGTSPNPVDSVLGRCARDVVVVPQQIMVAPHFIEDAGRVLLGLDPLEPAF